MAISKKRDESPSQSDDAGAEKPKSSAGRKVVLLLLLVATIVVVGLEYLPEGDSEPQVVGPPAKKLRAPAQSPAQPQRQQPAVPQRQQPAPVPTPTPPQYEKPGETLFVSSSPSDVPAMAAPAMMASAAAASPEPSPPAQTAKAEPAPAPETPAETVTAAVETPPAPTEPAAPETATEPAKAVVADAPTPPAEPLPEPAGSAPVASEPVAPEPVASAPAPELVASRSPAPATLPVQGDPEVVIIAEPPASATQAVARPLPDVAIPTKVTRYARRLFSRYDTNGDGVIDATERHHMQGDPAAIDYSADGEITLEELAAYTADFGQHRRMRLTGSMVEEAVAELPPLYIPTAEREAMAAAQAAQLAAAQQAAQLAAQQGTQQAQAVPVALVNETAETGAASTGNSDVEEEGSESVPSRPTGEQAGSKRFVTPKSRLAGLPEWFSARDMNGDGQLTVAEYTPGSEESLLDQFNRYDRNKDGVLTPQECPKQ